MHETGSSRERFQADLMRTVDRLRTLGLARLGASFAPEPTRADAARGVAQRLADRAAGLAGDSPRVVPGLAVQAAGDQVAVCGHDLLAAVDAALAAGDLTTAAADDELDEAAALLLDLRRRL
jgi:hypothetical protein